MFLANCAPCARGKGQIFAICNNMHKTSDAIFSCVDQALGGGDECRPCICITMKLFDVDCPIA